MHPNTKPTTIVLILCMVILGILLLPLPFSAYKSLRFLLSLGLLYQAGFLLRPCKNLMFQPSEDLLEIGTRNPYDGSFSGSLRGSRSNVQLESLTAENSEIVRFLDNEFFLNGRKSLPPISLKLSLGLVLSAVVMNPMAHIHFPRVIWMLLEVLILVLLGYAIHFIREENAGNKQHFQLTRTVGQPPEFPFMDAIKVFRHVRRLWPFIIGGTFVIGRIAGDVGGDGFGHFSLVHEIGQTLGALFVTLLLTYIICAFIDFSSNQGVKPEAKRSQVPGEFIITVFTIILMSLACGGYFTSQPKDEMVDTPADYNDSEY